MTPEQQSALFDATHKALAMWYVSLTLLCVLTVVVAALAFAIYSEQRSHRRALEEIRGLLAGRPLTPAS
jgi:hypothetical protein